MNQQSHCGSAASIRETRANVRSPLRSRGPLLFVAAAVVLSSLGTYQLGPRLARFAAGADVSPEPFWAVRPGVKTHRKVRSYGDVVASKLEWPGGQTKEGGKCSFRFEEWQYGMAIDSADLYVVQWDRSQPIDTWIRDLLKRGGPSSEELFKIDREAPGLSQRHDGDKWCFEASDYPFPVEDPLYLVARDSGGKVVQEVLLGPLYEESVSTFALKPDLDEARKR